MKLEAQVTKAELSQKKERKENRNQNILLIAWIFTQESTDVVSTMFQMYEAPEFTS